MSIATHVTNHFQNFIDALIKCSQVCFRLFNACLNKLGLNELGVREEKIDIDTTDIDFRKYFDEKSISIVETNAYAEQAKNNYRNCMTGKGFTCIADAATPGQKCEKKRIPINNF